MVDAEELDEDLSFPTEEVEMMVQNTADEVLKDVSWDETKVP